jgi:hypothetical protein
MKKTAYRLAEYKITTSEHSDSDLWWEAHIGLGSLKSGKCFINGDILFLKPTDVTEPGFLKKEFIDHLNKLPTWDKTKYYCTSYKIRPCKAGSGKSPRKGTGRGLQNTTSTIEDKSAFKLIPKPAHKSIEEDIGEPISYKLGHYEISEKNAERLFWKSCRGMAVAKAGKCHINGNILFLEPPEALLSSPGKKGTVQKSAGLPDWKKTEYYCRIYAIYYSNTGAICRRLTDDNDLERRTADTDTARSKERNAGKIIEAIVCDKTPIKRQLATVLNLCGRASCLFLKLLLKFFQLILEISEALIAKVRRSRG